MRQSGSIASLPPEKCRGQSKISDEILTLTPEIIMVSETERQLRGLLKERILLLDGAMGTMIQSYGLQEADYRGDRLAGHGCDL